MGLRITHFIFRWLVKLIYFPKYVNRDAIPEGGAIYCGNHTALFDPLFIIAMGTGKEFTYVIAKKELFKNKLFAKFLYFVQVFPVDRGSADLRAIKKSLEVLRGGHKLLIFPEGTRVNSPEESMAKNGIAMFAHKTGCPIVPVYITPGRKIPFRRITVTFGEPYQVDFNGVKPTQEDFARVADDAMKRVYALGGKT